MDLGDLECSELRSNSLIRETSNWKNLMQILTPQLTQLGSRIFVVGRPFRDAASHRCSQKGIIKDS